MAAIVDSGFFSMVAIDLEGTIVHWNRAAERLFGWRRIEAVGRSIDLIVPADRRDELAAMIATLRRGDEVLPIETVRRTKTGNDVCVCLQVSPVLDASGRLIGASKFGFDYTDQAATRAELAASEARYHALVDALSEFVVVTNADGEVVRPQSSWAAFTGQDDSTAGGRGWFDAVHPHDRTAFEGQWVQGAAVAEPFSLAGRLLHRGGEYRHCEGRVAPRRDALGRVVEWVAAFADVHERHLAQERERNTAERFRRIFAANVFGVCYGEHRSILDANAMMLDMLGVRRKELAAGIPWDDVIVSDAADPVDFGNGAAREFEVRRSDGSTAYLLAAGVSLAPDRGWLAVAVDVTQRKAAERETEHRALHDPLTGLANRQLLVDRLEHALSRARRQGSLVGVLFCDLDHFKEINDAYGHAVGDLALQTVARRLESLMRDSDTVARIGGDEFVIVLEDLADPGDAARISERIRAELSTPVTLEAHDITLSASIGVALNTDNDDRVETLLGRADNAMYRNKRHSQDQITLEPDHTDSPRCQASSRHEHAPALALADNTLDLETTPPIDLRACGAAGP
jgi:diguanylate cyclase (GGDEF)-like protein/PAS domain S-box-containing protein